MQDAGPRVWIVWHGSSAGAKMREEYYLAWRTVSPKMGIKLLVRFFAASLMFHVFVRSMHSVLAVSCLLLPTILFDVVKKFGRHLTVPRVFFWGGWGENGPWGESVYGTLQRGFFGVGWKASLGGGRVPYRCSWCFWWGIGVKSGICQEPVYSSVLRGFFAVVGGAMRPLRGVSTVPYHVAFFKGRGVKSGPREDPAYRTVRGWKAALAMSPCPVPFHVAFLRCLGWKAVLGRSPGEVPYNVVFLGKKILTHP